MTKYSQAESVKRSRATESILPYAVTYGSIYIISCIFNVFNVTMNDIVTSEGAAKSTMCALLIGAILNIALDPIFIYDVPERWLKNIFENSLSYFR